MSVDSCGGELFSERIVNSGVGVRRRGDLERGLAPYLTALQRGLADAPQLQPHPPPPTPRPPAAASRVK